MAGKLKSLQDKGVLIIILLVIILFTIKLQLSSRNTNNLNTSDDTKLISKSEFIKKCLQDKEFELIKCIALATDNVSLCNTLKRDGKVDEHQRENCRFRYFMTRAVLNDDISYCENLIGDRIIICELTVTYNDSFCSLLKEMPKEECFKIINQPIIPLENKSLIMSDENSLNYYTNIAIKEKKPELCDLWPIYRKVRKCKVIADPNLKTVDYCNKDILDQCTDLYYFELAKTSESKEECNKIKFFHKKKECLKFHT